MVKTDIGFIILVLRGKGLYDLYNFDTISLDNGLALYYLADKRIKSNEP